MTRTPIQSVTGLASSGIAAIECVQRQACDVVLMDVTQPIRVDALAQALLLAAARAAG